MFIPYNTDAPLYHYPIVTVLMILINCLVFFAMPSVPHAIERQTYEDSAEDSTERMLHEMLYDAPDPVEGVNPLDFVLPLGEGLTPLQWLTANFIHNDILHLMGNMFVIWGFGLLVEGKIGWWRYLLLYCGIGTVEYMIVQLCMMPFDFGIAYGASTICFGLIAVAMVWAPNNNMHCMLWLWIRPWFFEAPAYGVAVFMIVLQVLIQFATGFSLTSEVLHLLGAAIGFGAGVAMFKLGLVDCEGWDMFTVLAGKHKKSYAEVTGRTALEELQRESADKRRRKSQETLAKVQTLVGEGYARVAFAAYERLLDADGDVRLSEPTFRRLIAALIKSHDWTTAVDAITCYLATHTAHADRLRLTQAEILLRYEKKPAAALKALSDVSALNLSDDLLASHAKLRRAAEKLRAEEAAGD